MSRAQRPGHNLIIQNVTLACGASDADNLVDLVVPGPAAELIRVSATQKTAGTGTGTFSLQVKIGESSPTAVGAASSATFIDADAVAGTVHGDFFPQAGTTSADQYKHINVSTVKTGTVSGNATLLLTFTWEI